MRPPTRARLVPCLVLVTLSMSSCAKEDDADSEPAPFTGCPSTQVLVTTSDGRVGELAVLDPDRSEIRVASASNDDPDTVPARLGCTPVLLERSRGRIKIQSREDPLTTEGLIDVNPSGERGSYKANPLRVIQVAHRKAYALLGQVNEVIIFDPDSVAITGTINLSALAFTADTDGLVDVLDAIAIGDYLFVALGQYWFEQSAGQPPRIVFGGSEIAVIDTRDDSLIDVDPSTRAFDGIALEMQNPRRGMMSDGKTLWVVASGAQGAEQPVLDGGIEAIDLATLGSKGVVFSEMELGAELMGAVRTDAGVWWVLANDEVLALSLADATLRERIAQGVDDMARVEGSLYAWAGPGAFEGLRRFELASGDETTTGPTSWFVGDLPVVGVAGIP